MEEKVFYGNMTSIPESGQEQNIPEEQVQKLIGEKEISEALATLQEYQRAKAMLDNRVLDDENWWELRHWESLKRQPKNMTEEEAKNYIKNRAPEPSSAWLFNTITNKHADAMDNFPEPVVLPRELSDKESAKTLSEVLPVIMEYNEFEQTYSDSWWEKLKHGTAAYGVFWNSNKDNGLGDIDIKAIDLLKIYWQPGITDIQDSRNLFICDLVDTDLLEEQYPQYKGKLSGNNISLPQYQYDTQVDLSDKSVVVDWYYKVRRGTSTVLHYAKFVNNCLLYASENDPAYRERGFYDHGMYPVVFDVMFPEKNTPVGFGYVAICKDPQLYIDKVSGYVLENAMITAKKRYFVSEQTNVNEEEFLDWNQPIVHVSGMIDDTRIKEIVGQPVSPVVLNVVNQKIEEMKETSSNRDVNSGGGAGVTAAAAIAALQEAGNKMSRDMIASAYRAYRKIIKITVELIRQFYDEERTFRITLPNGTFDFVGISNQQIGEQPVMSPDGMPVVNGMGEILNRKPIFDLKIKAQKKNPFSRMEQNETAKELYRLGFFNPEQAQSAMIALDMMSFEGVEDLREKIQQGQTLQNMLQQVMAENMQLQAMLGMNPEMGGMPGGQVPMGAVPGGSPDTIGGAVAEAGTPMTPYGQALAKRSAPSAEDTGKVMR